MELLSAGSLHVHKAQIHFLTNCVCTLAVVVALFYSVCLCTISHLPFSFFFFIRDVSAMAAATSPAGEPIPTASNQGGQADTSSSDPKLQHEKLGNLSADIIPQLFKLYDCTATPADYEIYAPKAVFEDPLMQAHGVKQIKSAFYSIPKVFKEAEIVDYTITEEETTPGSGEIRIDNVQRYKVAGKTINMVSLIKLQIQDGKVVRHEDLWNKNPLWNKNTIKVPLIGRAFEGLRRGNMMFTHLLMGFGKDPHTKN